DRRPGRARRAAARRLLLRSGGADLGRPADRRRDRGGHGDAGRPCGTGGRPRDGGARVTGGRDGFGLAALVFGLLAFAVDVMDPEGFRLVSALPLGPLPLAFVLALGVWTAWVRPCSFGRSLILLAGVALAMVAAAAAVYDPAVRGRAGLSFWCFVAAIWALAWRAIDAIARRRHQARGAQRAIDILVPAAFGLWILFLWEMM